MAKAANNSKETLPATDSSGHPRRMSTRSMALKVKLTESMKKEKQLMINEEKVKRPQSSRRTKAKTKRDSKKPKKPPTAFFYFLEDFRKKYQEENSDVKSMRDVGKACGEKWKVMSYEEKVHYYDIATEKRAEFDRAMADYIKRKESGEDEDSASSDMTDNYE